MAGAMEVQKLHRAEVQDLCPDVDLLNLCNERLEKEGPKIWASYRTYDPASLWAVINWTERTLSALLQEDAPDRDEIGVLFVRLELAERLMHSRVVHLVDRPPEVGSIKSSLPPWAEAEIKDSAINKAIRDQHIQAEFDHRRDEGEKSKDIREDLSERYHLSPRTIKKIVYDE
jgi:hypothetical protein